MAGLAVRPWQLPFPAWTERQHSCCESKDMTQSLGHHLRDPLRGALFSLEVNMAWDEKLQSLPQILIVTIIFYSVVLYKII